MALSAAQLQKKVVAASSAMELRARLLAAEYRRRQGMKDARAIEEQAPQEWRAWLQTIMPRHFNKPLAQRHVDFWRWVIGLKLGVPARPYVAIYPRGGGKTTGAEGSCVAVGVRDRRRFAFYVRSTQKRADEAVQNIASMLESPEIGRYYPRHAERQLTKFGHSKGWTQTTLRTAGGFMVQALGLDTAARGVKLEEHRPDFMVFDDIDETFDSPQTIQKKLLTITKGILPAGTTDVAVLMIQNLVNTDGLFTQLVDGRAEFLSNRILSGPHPALLDFEWRWEQDAQSGTRRPIIVRGTPTWEGQGLEACQHELELIGPAAFTTELQHDLSKARQGIALRVSAANLAELTDEECGVLCAKRRVFAGIDFGEWRFGFVLFAMDEFGVCRQIDEVFSQRESLTQRAQAIHELCLLYGIEHMVPIWGDAANPQDIRELNAAFQRGWTVRPGDAGYRFLDQTQQATGAPVHITSKLRCVAVMMENKARRVAVNRINDALDAGRLLFRRNVGNYEWRVNFTAASEGRVMTGSRLQWELGRWSFPIPNPGEPQDQNPDDATADGADMVAATRYALMSWWGKALTAPDYGVVPDDTAEHYDYQRRRFVEAPHALDHVDHGPAHRRVPDVSQRRPSVLRRGTSSLPKAR